MSGGGDERGSVGQPTLALCGAGMTWESSDQAGECRRLTMCLAARILHPVSAPRGLECGRRLGNGVSGRSIHSGLRGEAQRSQSCELEIPGGRVLPAGMFGPRRSGSTKSTWSSVGLTTGRVLSAGLIGHTRRASLTRTVGVTSRRNQAQGAALAAGPTRV